ncbi:MAG TPA: addiction module protein [Longimicrobiales bacterium]|nr:addiction module protein [Longimicrobiales bacterium]
MTKEALLAAILRLPPEERIELLGDAWDAIAATPDDVPVPERHLDVLRERAEKPNPQFVSWSEVRERLKGHG